MKKIVETVRVSIRINGRVQGVGFRPTVYKYAKEKELSGWVKNNSDGVVIEAEGTRENIDSFVERLMSKPPPQADIKQVSTSVLPRRSKKGFRIISSSRNSEIKTDVSPDIGTCSECLGELSNQHDRRYLYPFINCTNCGPRFTIIENIPYDRGVTTMKKFTMCPDCDSEYTNPASRRFHAEPNACAVCGPEIEIVQSPKPETQSPECKTQDSGKTAIEKAIRLLREGEILAVKGLGGFHLACDALNEQAVVKLREKKSRENKPFALMAGDIDTIKEFCKVSLKEEQLLLSPKRPIVLLKKLSTLNSRLSAIFEAVAPNNKYLGFMLPYTPLHYLLFHSQLRILVMTSGNFSDEPIIYKNEDALRKLTGITNFLLVHNRDIFVQCDDSVVRILPDTGDEIILRRARGYVPEPITVQSINKTSILATGTHSKNTFCLAKDNKFIISQHIGDIGNFETFESFRSTIEHFKKLFRITPAVIACDLHPEYLATKYAVEYTTSNPDVGLVKVQHHHAHIVSCMADNGVDNHKVIGVAFDGTGIGNDGELWGGEFMITDYTGFERIAHLKYFPLPGGEKAIKEPWRTGVSLLYEIYGDQFPDIEVNFVKNLDKEKSLALKTMLDRGINCPKTSSIGRLFDGVSAILELRKQITYEGEAAIELEMAAEDKNRTDSYEYEVIEENNKSIIDYSLIIKGIVDDLKKREAASTISVKFHNTVVGLILEVCNKLRSSSGLNEVFLSGGVFQNMFILGKSYQHLTGNGFKVYINKHVPANDGGISFGQAVIASNRIENWEGSY